MISRIVVHDATQSIVPWWSEVEALRSLTEVCFRPGLNVLWGRNGAGKSTILKVLSRLTCSEQGGRSVVTEEAIRAFFPGFGADKQEKFGLLLEHDGQATVTASAGTRYGLGLGGFDDDFFLEGFISLNQKGSSGQNQMGLLDRALSQYMTVARPEPTSPKRTGRTPLMRREPAPPPEPAWPEVDWRVTEQGVNDLWAGRVRKMRERLFTAQIPTGPHTVILDEPDQSLDLDMQARLWAAMPRILRDKNLQVICATHSVFATNLPDAHYVELTPGYLAEVRAVLRGRFA